MQHFHSQAGRHECILTLPPYRSADIPVRSNVLPANGQQNAAELSFVNCFGQECPRSGGSFKMHPADIIKARPEVSPFATSINSGKEGERPERMLKVAVCARYSVLK